MSLRRQRGVSLVELMIALVLGLVLSAGVIQIYVANKQGYRVADAVSRLQENARFAMDVLTRDIRMASYQGCAGRVRPVANNLNSASAFYYDFDTPIQGFEATSSSAWTPTVNSSEIPSAVGDSDIVTIRGIFGSEVAITGSSDLSNCNTADLIVASATDFATDDIVIAANCANAAIFQITSFTAGTGTGTVAHAGTGSSPGNSTADLGTCYADNGELAEITTRTFYIRNNTDGVPSLYRKDGVSNAVELVEGVENMQILYGEDTDDDLSANKYVPANAVGDWSRVVSVRISLLLRSAEDNVVSEPQTYTYNGAKPTATDRRLRRVYTTTIGLRNRIP